MSNLSSFGKTCGKQEKQKRVQKRMKNSVTLFYSYSHKDEKYRDALSKHLSLLMRKGVIKEWHDRKITPGEEWENAIDEHIEKADIILLLVSPDFIASGYCWGKEVAQAMKRQKANEACVIPIIVRPVDWQGASFGRLQALPKNAKPVTLWQPQDNAWLNVAKGIHEAITEIGKELQSKNQEPTSSQSLSKIRPVKVISPPKSKLQPVKRPGGHLHRIIYNANNKEELSIRRIARGEGDLPTGDITIDETYDALGITHDFFWNIYERDSIDGEGMPLKATVHFGQAYGNSFWDGLMMVFGDGDGKIINSLTRGVDSIASHFVKGVINATANLQYFRQSGALHSSISNVFASLVKQYAAGQTANQANWLIGDGNFISKVDGNAWVSLANPGTAYDDPEIGKDPQPAHMRDFIRTYEDNGGIHINSGIPNRAFYLIATALRGYAWEKAGRIWYETLRDKRLRPNTGFRRFAQITFSIAQRLHGDKSDEALAVKYGWEMVGIKVSGK